MTRTKYKYSYEENKKVAAIRHTQTAYDKYDIFYHINLGGRKKLNSKCAQLLSDEISYAEFADFQKEILNEVNLNKKSNQRRLAAQYMLNLQQINPGASNHSNKTRAKKFVKNLLLFQERRNLRRSRREKLRFIED